MGETGWARVLLYLCVLKVGAGWLGVAAGQAPAGPAERMFPIAVYALHVLVYSLAAGLLTFGNRGDRRAARLSTLFLIIAASFSDRQTLWLGAFLPRGADILPTLLVQGLRPDAFLPWCLWRFVREFPRVPAGARAAALSRGFLRAALVAGLLLFAGNLALALMPSLVPRSPGHPPLTPGSGSYWALLFALLAPALPFAVAQARAAPEDERRRVSLFLRGLVLGALPVSLAVLLEALVPAWRAWVSRPPVETWSAILVYAGLLSIPISTTYAVLVHRVLEIRLVVRRALQHALARYTVLALAVAPFAFLVGYLAAHREESLTSLLSGGRPLGLAGAAVAGFVLLGLRSRILEALDRRFFREQYDARRILAELALKVRAAAAPDDLAALLTGEIDRALHVRAAVVLTLEPEHARLAAPDGSLAPLALESPLVTLLAGAAEPLEVDLEAGSSPSLAGLPEAERGWLRASGLELLVPLVDSTGSLIGLVGLGAKRSELPFSREDRLLLGAIAHAGALALENRLLRSTPSPQPRDAEGAAVAAAPEADREPPARECGRCLSVHPAAVTGCPVCAGPLVEAQIPYLLHGKFRFDRRLGAGGMGLVYLAVDVGLARRVAIKTLPRVAPQAMLRLRREAKATAALSHPNVALIHSIETWRGVPLLVFEYLGGGTLADRLLRGPLPVGEALALGSTLAGVLVHAHAEGILHRDIKPSNVGYTEHGVPKLLDFGLARLYDDSRPTDVSPSIDADPSDAVTCSDHLMSILTLTASGAIAGTPCYLSPEALGGEPPNPSFDLWSLGLLLYEAVTARNPLRGATLARTLENIRGHDIADPRELRPGLPDEVARFLGRALSAQRRERPATAAAFREQVEALRLRLATS